VCEGSRDATDGADQDSSQARLIHAGVHSCENQEGAREGNKETLERTRARVRRPWLVVANGFVLRGRETRLVLRGWVG
jgi:hypothetical protein